MSIKTVLFGKVDLDTIATALVMGVSPLEQVFSAIGGSAAEAQLRDPSTLCIEVGGSGRVSENDFDHHGCASLAEARDLSACAQALERLARLIRYVDEVDRGVLSGKPFKGFPSLVQLVSGMLLCIREPEEQMKAGLRIFREVLYSGIDPYASMERILDNLPRGREFAQVKKNHERWFKQALSQTKWSTTPHGFKLAVVETTWVGAPGALYGEGADIVIALNPRHEQGGKVYRKFTVCGHRISVSNALTHLSQLEPGWGGPTHGTIVGSPVGQDSELSLEQVIQIVTDNVTKDCELAGREDRKIHEKFSALCRIA